MSLSLRFFSLPVPLVAPLKFNGTVMVKTLALLVLRLLWRIYLFLVGSQYLANLVVVRGAKPKVISEALVHASVAFTMDTYSHIISGMQEDMMALLDEALPAGFLVERLIKQS